MPKTQSNFTAYFANSVYLFRARTQAKKEDNRECVNIPSKKYKLKEYDGNLAIFKSDAPNPIKITSIEIQALPLKDQELLKKGIDASSEEELNDLIEDYCS